MISKTLLDILTYRGQYQADKQAYIFLQNGETESVRLTYGELDRQARALATYFQDWQGERALLLYPSGLEFITAFFGCLYAGVVAVPVYPPRRNQKLHRLLSIVNDAQAQVALTTTSILADIEKRCFEEAELAHLKWVATDTIEANSLEFIPKSLTRESLAFLQYTSGSTGTPKGVMVTHGNIIHNQQLIHQAFGHSEKSIGVSWLPLFHDMGLIGHVLQPIYAGSPNILMPPLAFLQKPICWLKAISKYRGTTSGGPNFAYDLCVKKIQPEQLANLDLSSWDLAFNGAEPVRAETLEQFSEKFASCGFNDRAFYPCYGMAETTLFTTGGDKNLKPVIQGIKAQKLEENSVVESEISSKESRVFVGVGRPYMDTTVIIVNPESLTRSRTGQVGEIWVSGGSIASGYWNRPEATQETFQGYLKDTGSGPFLRTGDLGFFNNGELFVTGRLKDVIIIYGRNHYPQDIELSVQKSHPALQANGGAAFSIEVEGEEKLVVVQEVERTYIHQLNSDEVVEAINQAISLEHELAIHSIVLLKPGSIPKTSSGKIQRSACQQKFLDGSLQNVVFTKCLQKVTTQVKGIKFSLLYFSSNEAEFTEHKYRLLLEGAKFADQNDFHAIWIPERHFHPFGGLYPNPSVLSAALTPLTKRIRLRAGSVVLPLHDPIRVVEEWSIVDNLSHGRVDLAFARGWNPNDFVLSPDAYADSKEIMFSGIQTVQKLWRGENISLLNGVGKQTDIKIYPLPIQRELSIWITCTGGKERFIEAGASGFNILTALLFQPVEELAQKIVLYREARKQHGYDPDSGQVTLMLHTFIGDDLKEIRNQVRGPFIEYIKSSVNLWRQGSEDLDKLTETEQENLMAYAFERYFHTSALFGTPNTCLEMVQRLQGIGVDEIACLIDFGIDSNTVLASLNSLNNLRELVNSVDELSTKETSRGNVESHKQTKVDVLKQTNNVTINNSLLLPAPSIETSLEIPSRQNELQVTQGSLVQWLSEVIIEQIANSLGKNTSQISLDKSFHSFGIDSLKAVEIMETLGEKFGFFISPTLLFEYPTPTELALYLIQEQKAQLQKYLLVNWKPDKSWAVNLKRQQTVVSNLSNQLSNPSNAKVVEPIDDRIPTEDIAVIGMSGRFPQSSDLQSFWQLLSLGKNAITEVPSLRWNLQDWYDKNPDVPNKTYSRWGGFVDHIDQFDPLFFQISPREAELMDPQQRLFLEVAWEALENAGYSPESFAQTQMGVFVGCSNNGYYQRIAPTLNTSDYSAGIGNQNAIIANRVSFLLNLRGPSILVDTMCSSSLVALHMACRSLHQGECTTALAGGVNLLLSPEYYVGMSRMKMHSPNGRCATFDRQADGIVLGEGAGALLLKPLSRALKDGDRIYAVIKGSAVNHDGQTNGITAPNPRSQAEVICQALDAAGISADTISYVEAHGTGTSLGDPIEIEGLTKAFRKYTDRQQFCKIGSVKTNIGHLESAAGMAQVIKVILAIQHGQIPPNVHFQQSNPLISFAETPFEVNTKLCSWDSVGLRRAGISSFGIGGTNAHIIIEEPPSAIQNEDAMERPKHLLTLSAKTEKALIQLISSYETYLAAHPDLELGDICFTANTGRSHFQHRASAIAASTSDLHQKLVNFIHEKEFTGIKIGRIYENTPPKVAFLFTGQGSQYIGMGRHLYETQPTFRQILNHCNEILLSDLQEPLLKVLYPEPGEISPLDQTIYAQPAIFAIEYALFELWQSWGIKPDVVMGHSVGEYVAATVAGVFSLEDGLKLIAYRGRLMQQLPGGGEMLAVMASLEKVNQLMTPYTEKVAIAAINGPENIVISGAAEAIGQMRNSLEAEGIKTKQLQVSHAFHSPMMAPMLAEFKTVANQITYNQPNISLISNITGTRADESITTASYWVNHVRQPVKFAQSMETLYQEGYEVFLEIGPKPILLGIGRQCLPSGVGVWLPSLGFGREDWQEMLHSLGELYVQGIKVDWLGFDRDYFHRKVILPTYPFQRQRYWIETNYTTANQQPSWQLQMQGVEHLSHQTKIQDPYTDWFYELQWQPKPLVKKLESSSVREQGSWIIFADRLGIGQSLAKLLEAQGETCFVVHSSKEERISQAGEILLDPKDPQAMEELIEQIGTQQPCRGVVHLWSLNTTSREETTISSLEKDWTLTLTSTLNLVQSLTRRTDASHLPLLWLVTQGAQKTGSEAVPPAIAQALTWGLGRSLSTEMPQIWGGLVDIADEFSTDDARYCKALFETIWHQDGESQIALRCEQRYVARLVPSEKVQINTPSISLHSHATYLITGGLGYLGLNTARWMVDKGAKNIVLVGRSDASSTARQAIAQLEDHGAKVLVVKADVSISGDVVRILDKIKADYPPLRGIFHAAGVAGFHPLPEMTPELIKPVLDPKVLGTWNLHQITLGIKLDFFVCISSIASVWGSEGLGDYAAANHFLDIFAHYRHSLKLPALTVNIGALSGGGMHYHQDFTRAEKLLVQIGLKYYSPQDLLKTVEYCLEIGTAQQVIVDIDWTIFKALYELRERRTLLQQIEVRSLKPLKRQLGQPGEVLHQFKNVPQDDRYHLLLAYVQGKVGVVLKLQDSQLPTPEDNLMKIGMDSLTAVELKNDLQKELGIDIPIIQFIGGTTIAALATELNKQLTQGDREREVELTGDNKLKQISEHNNGWIEGEI